MSKPFPVSDLVRLVGDDHIFVQNLLENTKKVSRGRRDATVTFVTGPQFIKPEDALEPEKAEYIGLVLWLPQKRVREAEAVWSRDERTTT